MSRKVSPPQVTPADPAFARERRNLDERIVAALGDGLPVPCLGPQSRAWTSEDVADRAAAAQACRTCPALRECREFGQRWPGEVGVYGGDSRLTRPKREAS